jgi:hypothetical protein
MFSGENGSFLAFNDSSQALITDGIFDGQ